MILYKKRTILVLVTIVLIATPMIARGIGINPYANGHDWLGYSQQEKLSLVRLLYNILRVDHRRYQIVDGVQTLNFFYYYAIVKGKREPSRYHTNKLLNLSCLEVIAEIVKLKLRNDE